MRYSFLFFIAAALASYRVAAECCGTNGLDSCCSGGTGTGSCDIFCCNCEEGCGEEDVCSNECLGLCLQGCPPLPTNPKQWTWIGQQCYIECGKQCGDLGMADTSNDTTAMRLARNVFKRGIDMSDDAIFRDVDREGLGHFSYNQFLQRQGWQDNEGARAHFDRYDLDGDGVIKIGEMRIDGYLDRFW